MDAIQVLRKDRIADTDRSGQMLLRWMEENCITATIESGVECLLMVLLPDYLAFTEEHGDRYAGHDLVPWMLDYWDRVHPLAAPRVWRKPDPNPYIRAGTTYRMLGLTLRTMPEPKEADYVDGQIQLIRRWMHACCDMERSSTGDKVQSSDLYRSFVAWCESQDLRPLAQRIFSGTLAGCGYEPCRSHGVRYIRGLALKPIEDR